jgi:hypothetical protein
MCIVHRHDLGSLLEPSPNLMNAHGLEVSLGTPEVRLSPRGLAENNVVLKHGLHALKHFGSVRNSVWY